MGGPWPLWMSPFGLLYIAHGEILMTTCVDSPSYVIQSKVNPSCCVLRANSAYNSERG